MAAKIPKCCIKMNGHAFMMDVAPGSITWTSPKQLTATTIEEAVSEAREILSTNYNGGEPVGIMNETISQEMAEFEAILPEE